MMTPMMKPILVDLSNGTMAKIVPDEQSPVLTIMQAEAVIAFGAFDTTRVVLPARSITINEGVGALIRLRDALTEAIDMYGIDDEYEDVDDEEE